jgi:hypothetical protein
MIISLHSLLCGGVSLVELHTLNNSPPKDLLLGKMVIFCLELKISKFKMTLQHSNEVGCRCLPSFWQKVLIEMKRQRNTQWYYIRTKYNTPEPINCKLT